MRAARRFLLAAPALVALVLGAGCGGDDDDPSATLGPIGSGSGPATTGSAASAAPTASASQGTGGGAMGSGFVSIQVRLAATGIDETLSLDRSTVAASELDPISLDAQCTLLDGGGGDALTVAVIDLRRMAAGSRLVSAVLRVDGEVAAAGDYEGTLELGDADQVTSTYSGTVSVDPSLLAGTFAMVDERGGAATGSFVCAAEAVTTTTTPIGGSGEEVPGTEAPPPTSATTTTVAAPPVVPPAVTAPPAP